MSSLGSGGLDLESVFCSRWLGYSYHVGAVVGLDARRLDNWWLGSRVHFDDVTNARCKVCFK